MGKLTQGLCYPRQALVSALSQLLILAKKGLQVLRQRFLQAVELQAGQIIGFIFQLGVSRQKAGGDHGLNIIASGR